MDLYKDADEIIQGALEAVKVKEGVIKAVKGFSQKAYFIAIGKAAWDMADGVMEALGEHIIQGIVITKYGHSKGPIEKVEIYEAGHPVLDENAIKATAAALSMVGDLSKDDRVLFLVSGGGSALFEQLEEGVSLVDMALITEKLLACGCDIVEMNTIRKRLSAVKGGKFAKYCEPARVFTIILSDILGDKVEYIASGPTFHDSSTMKDVAKILNRYDLSLPEKIIPLLYKKPLKLKYEPEFVIIGNINLLCQAAYERAAQLGYKPLILSTSLDCEAAQAGLFIASLAKCFSEKEHDEPIALIFGGETVVKVTGSGLGGRNQELVLSAAKSINGFENIVIFSIGSDGTDGPTDAAGGLIDGSTAGALKAQGIDIDDVLKRNDAYHGLEAVNGLIKTGPTGSNVNDLMVVLIR